MPVKPHFIKAVVFVTCIAFGGCANPNNNSSYSRADVGRVATVMKGKILALRSVNISGTTNVGTGAGAVAGGVAGAGIGQGGRANAIGAIGGAVVGGVIGSVAENSVTKGMAIEFIIQQENEQTIAIVQSNEDGLAVGDKVLILRSGNVRIVKDTIAH